jgi:hypothetical protein
VVFRVGRVLDLERRFLRFLLIVSVWVDYFVVEVAQEVTQLILKFRCNPWSDSGDRARGSWGLTRGLFFLSVWAKPV